MRLAPLLAARRRGHGFTMIELLVVVAIIAIGSAGVAFALRDSAANQLEREGLRLASLFEAARAQSRSTGRPIVWQPTEAGFRFVGAMDGTLPNHWLSDAVQVHGTPVLVLGPEPVIGPQEVVLVSTALPDRSVRVVTGGLRPFRLAGEGIPP
ncbi:prepilin-type N-terminal cleavage/methylation domain-containing protein [Ramlibacter sp. AN1015]|uniref:pilus assembly FimT family protein n=1 Tax=Ramlibacter sp. AN1015 TaxID=3133428 RepID=UPI0030C2A499